MFTLTIWIATMIPKKIHYCWFGGNEIGPLFARCLASWKKFLPDYEIICWNESNLPKEANLAWKYIKEKKYAFASDYARYYILYQQGGIYLDTDVEVVKPFDSLLNNTCFIGYEDKNRIACGIIGAIAKNKFSYHCMSIMNDVAENNKAFLIAPEVANRAVSLSENVTIYPEEYFYPYNPYSENQKVKQLMFSDITENTYAIHHWEKKWSMGFMTKLKRFLIRN